jgi:hypothetical protein
MKRNQRSITMPTQNAVGLVAAFAVPVLAALALTGSAGCKEQEAVADTGDYELVVFDPSGATEISVLHAERLTSLEGQTICLLSDFMWEAERTMTRIEENLTESHPQAAIVSAAELPDVYRINLDDLETAVTEKGCEAAIVGNAG